MSSVIIQMDNFAKVCLVDLGQSLQVNKSVQFRLIWKLLLLENCKYVQDNERCGCMS